MTNQMDMRFADVLAIEREIDTNDSELDKSWEARWSDVQSSFYAIKPKNADEALTQIIALMAEDTQNWSLGEEVLRNMLHLLPPATKSHAIDCLERFEAHRAVKQ